MKLLSIALLFTFLVVKSNAQANAFVRVKNGSFVLAGETYQFIGANYWYGGVLSLTTNGKERVKKELDFLQQNSVTVLRIMVGAEGSGLISEIQRVGPALQKSSKEFDEQVLTGLDYLLSEMGKRNIKAILFFSNNWEWSGGFLQLLNWNGKLADSILQRKLTWDENRDIVSQFYNCTKCKEDYYRKIKFILTHKNVYTKKLYVNDPSIFGWELANEPRPMRPSAIKNYVAWIKESANLIKQLDKNHLVTIGVEGRIGTEGIKNFETIHQIKNIDFATIHIWPKNWAWYKDSTFSKDFATVVNNTTNYIDEHLKVTTSLNKPLVIEEFGLPRDGFSFNKTSKTTYRDKYFETVFKYLVNKNNKVAGTCFWAFGGYGITANNPTNYWKEGDDLIGDPPMEEQGLNTVFASDATTWDLVKKYVLKIKNGK